MLLRKTINAFLPFTGVIWGALASADTTQARCDIYPTGSDQAVAVVPCMFSQRQGAVTITLDNGTSYSLRPSPEVPGTYTDQLGRAAYRNSGLGRDGLIFRLQDSSIYVYWNTSALQHSAGDPDNPTAPYSTDDYDATMLLRCRTAANAELQWCPAGALRMQNRQASIRVTSPRGEELTINFMTDYVNATAGEVVARLRGDTWTVSVDGVGVFEVPQAVIEGG